MQIVVLTERCRDYEVRSGRVKEHAANEPDLARLFWEVDVCNEARRYWLVLIEHPRVQRTIYVRRTVKVNAQYTTSRKSQDEDIIGYLSSNKVRRNGELKLYSFNLENRQGVFFDILHLVEEFKLHLRDITVAWTCQIDLVGDLEAQACWGCIFGFRARRSARFPTGGRIEGCPGTESTEANVLPD